MTLALIRHGQTDWNAQRVFQGSSDIPLNEVGRQQARETAEMLASESQKWDAIVSSPLSRARETAHIIAEGLGLELGPAIDEWTERSYGIYEGQPAAPELRTHESVERVHSVIARGRSGLARVTELYPDRAVLIVAHGTIIRYTLNDLMGGDPEEPGVPGIINGALSLISFDRDSHSWSLDAINLSPQGVSL